MDKTRQIIVADAGPLIVLARIGQLSLLTRLFSTVLVPEAVRRESCRDLVRPGASVLRAAFDEGALQTARDPRTEDLAFPASLGVGERAAIGLAKSREAGLLVDDRAARRFARRLGIRVLGVGGLLVIAKNEGLIPKVAPVLKALRRADYRISTGIEREILRLAKEAVE